MIAVMIEEKTLTDGSKVYNVIIKQWEQRIEINCIDEKQAVYLQKEIAYTINDNSNNIVKLI